MHKYEIVKHYVIFYSPGTFVAETTEKEVERLDVNAAVKMSKEIKERHGALPYGFKFVTRGREKQDLDSKIIDSSGMYYLGGIVKTLEDLEKENNPDNRILISNMKCNKWNRVVTNNNSYKWTQPLNDNDIVLEIGT